MTVHGVAKKRIRHDVATEQQQERQLLPEEIIRLKSAQIEKQQRERLTRDAPPFQTVISGDPAKRGGWPAGRGQA